MEELALQAVRKAKAKKAHLTVPATVDADIRTLCGVEMKAGDYELVDDADCQPCLRRKGNRAFISSAYFAQDAGVKLLEMSVQQAKARPGARREGSKVRRERSPGRHSREPAGPPSLRVVAADEPDPDAPSPAEQRKLGVDRLNPAGPGVYRSAEGVLVRVAKRKDGWRVSEVAFDGPSQVRAARDGMAVQVGDLEVRAGDGGALSVRVRSR
jgi:hypothetical protein